MRDPTVTPKQLEGDRLVAKLAEEGLELFSGVVVIGALVEGGEVSVFVDSQGRGENASAILPRLAAELINVAAMLAGHASGAAPLPKEPPETVTS